MAELKSSNRNPLACKAPNIYHLVLYKTSLLTPSLSAVVEKYEALDRIGRPKTLTMKGQERKREKRWTGKEKQGNNKKSTNEDEQGNQKVIRQRDTSDHPSKFQVWSLSI